MCYPLLKSILDRIVALLLILILFPLLCILSICVFLDLGFPIFFRQPRPGLNSRVFHIYKFRTMRTPDQGQPCSTSDQSRLTSFGRFLRSTSLDELPALINILCGDLSFVGPRPLLVQYLDLYTPVQARRHKVMPGLTGLAQISGRNLLSWDQKFHFDNIYVSNQSFFLDFKIIILTFFVVFKREGISASGSDTCPPFCGQTD